MVRLERQGKVLGLGAVLEGDGRLVSALGALGGSQGLTARYHDGTVLPLKLVHQDRNWDLALLDPLPASGSAAPSSGLRAARTPSFEGLQTFTTAAGAVAPQPISLTVSPGVFANQPDALPLNGAYDVSLKAVPLGSPVVNADGEVVALVASACSRDARTGRCAELRYGVPVTALKQFLQRTPASASWLGVETASDELGGVRGLRVLSVALGSPAARGGLRPGPDGVGADLIVAVDGVPVSKPAELNEAVRARLVGDWVELLLFGGGRYRQVAVKPSPAPEVRPAPYTAPKQPKPRTPNPYR